jgi:hypothetical protein
MKRSAGKSRRDSAGEKRSQSYLSGGIDNLGRKVLALVPYNLAKSILDGGVIALDKVAVDKLHRQTRFAYFALQSAPQLRRREIQGTSNSPTALLPTMATLRCLGAGMLFLLAGLLLLFGLERETAERVASLECLEAGSVVFLAPALVPFKCSPEKYC